MSDIAPEKGASLKPGAEQAAQAAEKMCLTHSILDSTDRSGAPVKNAVVQDAIVKDGTNTGDSRNTEISTFLQTYQTSIGDHLYVSLYDGKGKPTIVAREDDDRKSITKLKPDSDEYKTAVAKLDSVRNLIKTLPDCAIENK